MMKTVAFVTNQYSCERIIKAAKEVADNNQSELVVVAIQDYQYEMNPQAVDFLFSKSKEYGASMRLIFNNDVPAVMREVINQYECRYIVTGMPSTNNSVIYGLWKEYSNKSFYTIDLDGKVVEVVNVPETTEPTAKTKLAKAL